MPQEQTRLTHAERVLNFLKGQDQPLSAYEILDALRKDGVTAPTTVYRALAKLLDAGHVHRIESLNAWVACCEPHHSDAAVFEICDGCGSVKEHVASHLASNIATLTTHSGFVPNRSIIEIHGRCSDCCPTTQNS